MTTSPLHSHLNLYLLKLPLKVRRDLDNVNASRLPPVSLPPRRASKESPTTRASNAIRQIVEPASRTILVAITIDSAPLRSHLNQIPVTSSTPKHAEPI